MQIILITRWHSFQLKAWKKDTFIFIHISYRASAHSLVMSTVKENRFVISNNFTLQWKTLDITISCSSAHWIEILSMGIYNFSIKYFFRPGLKNSKPICGIVPNFNFLFGFMKSYKIHTFVSVQKFIEIHININISVVYISIRNTYGVQLGV